MTVRAHALDVIYSMATSKFSIHTTPYTHYLYQDPPPDCLRPVLSFPSPFHHRQLLNSISCNVHNSSPTPSAAQRNNRSCLTHCLSIMILFKSRAPLHPMNSHPSCTVPCRAVPSLPRSTRPNHRTALHHASPTSFLPSFLPSSVP